MEKTKKGVRLEHVSKIYQDPKTGKDFYAVHDTSLSIEPGSFVTLLGPSGCGKTTTLRMIAGFESPDEGEIYLGDEAINALTPNKRDTAMVFQSYALLPHYNVFDNVAYGLKLRKIPKDEIRERVMRILDLVELTGMEGRMTNQLSGGQQQRVALARALVIEPSVLLFDEPLSNLDAKLRVSMRTEIRRIQQEVGITAIYVTHDQSEAMALSDNIIIMNKGVVAQVGTPQEIYYHPNSEFVADFIGEANFLKGSFVRSTDDGRAVMNIEGGEIEVAPQGELEAGHEYTLGSAPRSRNARRRGRPALPRGAQLLHGFLPELPRHGRRHAREAVREQPQEQAHLRRRRGVPSALRSGRGARSVKEIIIIKNLLPQMRRQVFYALLLVSVDKGRHARQCVFPSRQKKLAPFRFRLAAKAALCNLLLPSQIKPTSLGFDLNYRRATARLRLKKTKITRKSIPVRCKAVLTEQKCGQTMKRPQRILAVLSRTLKQYGRISARQNRVYPCQLILS